MFRVKRIKLAYKVIGIYLASHILIAMSILAIIGVSIKIMEEAFIERYLMNAEQHMEYFDEELFNLKSLLVYTMQNQSILVLKEQYDQLSEYNKVKWKKQAKEEIVTLASQYKWIRDIGIYIPEIDLWVTSIGWFEADKNIDRLDENVLLDMVDNTLYVHMRDQEKNTKAYIRIDSYEMNKLIDKIRFDKEIYVETRINGKLLEQETTEEQRLAKRDRKLTIKSSLYPIEMDIYIGDKHLSLGRYFYLFSMISLVLLIFITIKFARYLNKAIHKPLHNVVNHIEGMNQENFEDKLEHIGMDEFDYVTESFNKTKALLEEYIKKSYEQEISMKQMELDHLQEQIKPHFLYNCFFNIASMCKTYDVDKIEQLTLELAKYYRYITRTNHEFVRLEDEYEHMKSYIAIQKIRFEDRVKLEVALLPDGFKDLYVPRLILQPIVENAYKYVFDKIEGGGHLRISTSMEAFENKVVIQIEDNGQFIGEEKIKDLQERMEDTKGAVTGLKNIKRRVQYIDKRNTLTVDRSIVGGIAIKLIIYRNNE